MSTKSTVRKQWSLSRKLLVGLVLFLTVFALVLGLGLGLTLRNDSGNDDSNNTDPPALTPQPSPNYTLPWTPNINDTWQIILSHPPVLSTAVMPNVSIFDVDLFDTPTSTIEQFHKAGKKVLCYFSAGSYEDWRSDAKEFKNRDLGKTLDGWAGEKWLKLDSIDVRDIMKRRIKMAKEKSCDGIDPDNVDGYENDNGLGLTTNDSIAYLQYLSSIAHPLNLTLGLKNARSIISAVLPIVDFSVNEQCMSYDECDSFRAFTAVGKPVLHIEYPAGDRDLEPGVERAGFGEDVRSRYCGKDSKGSKGLSTVLKKMTLDGWVQYCDGKVDVTSVDDGVGGHTQKFSRK